MTLCSVFANMSAQCGSSPSRRGMGHVGATRRVVPRSAKNSHARHRVSLRHIPLTPKDQEWHAIFFGLNAHCDPDDTGAIFIERNFSVANRKERRSVAAGTRSKGPAKKAVIPRDYTIEIADEIHEAWRSGFRSMPTKPEVDAQIEDLYQSHVAVPVAGQAAVSLTNDPDGLMTPRTGYDQPGR